MSGKGVRVVHIDKNNPFETCADLLVADLLNGVAHVVSQGLGEAPLLSLIAGAIDAEWQRSVSGAGVDRDLAVSQRQSAASRHVAASKTVPVEVPPDER